jgi:predicted amidohydrolase YtcJ
MERELGSVAVGKLAHFTVQSEDPDAVDPERLNRIPVLGTVFAGRSFVASR